MQDLPTIVCLSLAALLGAIGVVQLAGPRFLRDAYVRWGYSQRLRIVTGLLDLAAAMMLVEPDLRVWGVTLVGVLTFGAVVTLLNHRHYFAAAAAILMMVALVPAALAVPRPDNAGYIVIAPPAADDTR